MIDDSMYKKLIRDMKLRPLQYRNIADDWLEDSNEWYHAMVADEDLPIVLAIPSLQIYSWCRCKLVANDNSEAHFHWHALVHFKKQKLESWRRQARHLNIYFKSTKNTFKKIKCLDHAVGVLRYISCKDGQKVGRRDKDGLVTHPHVHYSRQPIDPRHCHDTRGKRCVEVRDEISKGIAQHIDLTLLANWSEKQLHNEDECLCDRGLKGKERKRIANEKRRSFYKTDAGIAIKAKYREKAATKRKIMNMLLAMNVSKKAELCKETIENLINQM